MFLYGIHPCVAALQNPTRVVEKIYVTDAKLLERNPFAGLLRGEKVDNSSARGVVTEGMPQKSAQRAKAKGVSPKIVQILPKEKLQALLPPGAVHQGIAIQTQPLYDLDLSDLLRSDEPNQILVILDQVSDPHNVGAILRSCAVFGAQGLILTDRNAPKESATLAKTASGAMEIVPLCYVKNLAHSLKEIKAAGFWCVAFAEEATQQLSEIDLKGKIALVMGAEGDGVRRLTAENCDFYVRLDSASTFSTLNVSNAAAIALYETFQKQRKI